MPLEAMASGRPVIAFGKGGATETIVAGKTGQFFYKQTAEAIIEAVKKFKPEDYDSKIIRNHALKFSKDRFKKEFKEVVKKMVLEYQKEME